MEPPYDPEVSVLVVAYHSAPFIAQCMRGIAEGARETAHEILMIDNGGGDTEAIVRTEFPHVRIVPGEGNIGFGAGNNRAAAQARAPFLLLVNPDAVPYPGAIDRLVAFAKAHPEAAAWGGCSYTPDGAPEHANFLILPRPIDFVRAIVIGTAFCRTDMSAETQTPGPVDVLNGGFMMVSRAVWEEIGGFDESFFLYSEEVDMFQRLRARGHAVLVDPGVKVMHDAGSGEAISATRVLYITTGRMHYARKHYGPLGARVAGWAMWLNAAKYVLMGGVLARVSARNPRWREISQAWTPVFRERSRWWNGYRDRARG